MTKTFWEKVNKTKNCWEWIGAKTDFGYGMIKRKGRKVVMHRFSWELHKGKIPKGLFVLHKCDNPPCVNPDHLFLGTQKDNMQDMFKKGRANHKSGEKAPHSKLKDVQINKIRELWKTGKYVQREIAKVFSIDQSLVSMIVNNKHR